MIIFRIQIIVLPDGIRWPRLHHDQFEQYYTIHRVSSDLYGRVWQHKQKVDPNSFTAKYNCVKLVWYEFHISIEEAIAREKQIKKWRRVKKNVLIESFNPAWKDLFEDIEP